MAPIGKKSSCFQPQSHWRRHQSKSENQSVKAVNKPLVWVRHKWAVQMKLGPSGRVSKGWCGQSPARFDGLLMLGVGLSQYFAGLSCRNDIQQINGTPELMWGCCIIPPSSIKMTTQQLPLNLCHSPSTDQSPRLPTFSPCFSLSLLLSPSMASPKHRNIFIPSARTAFRRRATCVRRFFRGLSLPADNPQKWQRRCRSHNEFMWNCPTGLTFNF